MVMRRIISVATVILLGINLVVGFRIYAREAAASETGKVLQNLDIMMQVLQKIRTEYVDADTLDDQRLITDAINGMTQSLDPFSVYLPKADMKELEEHDLGKRSGIGIVYALQEDGTPQIQEVLPDSPGERAGLREGDEMLSADGTALKGMSLEKIADKLQGGEGEKVTLQLRRGGADGKVFDAEIIRANIVFPTVRNAHVIDGTRIAYLAVDEFIMPTVDEFEKELRKLAAKNPEGLIIDLRENPGGLLHVARELCSVFLKAGQLVVSVEGPREDYKLEAVEGYKFPAEIPVAILVNGGSASAAEVMASCLRDYRKATLIGECTFGKGSVQNVHYFGDGSGLKLTVAKYFTRSRTPIHGAGLEPDVLSEISDEEWNELWKIKDQAQRDAADKNIRDAVKFLQDSNKQID